MYTRLFRDFVKSGDTLRVYQGKQLLFASQKDRLLPLLEYIEQLLPGQQPVVLFDTIMGNAAALLAVKAGCREVYSPLASQLAIMTLEKYGIKYYFSEVVPYIQQPDQSMCPMERLSLDKEPEEFYNLVRNI